MNQTDLLSSVKRKGKKVTQIVTCTTGIRKTFRGILTDTIETSTFTKFDCVDGRMVLVYDPNVFTVEVFPENNDNLCKKTKRSKTS